MPVLILDSGHGGHDSGAVNTKTKLKEKDVVLDVALRARRLLIGEDIKVVLTRTDDTFISLTQRAVISNNAAASLFLSIHCNSADAATANGFEAFTSPGKTKADDAATKLINRYQKEFPGIRLRSDWSDGDPDKEARFTVLTGTKAPAVLLELEFIHTKEGSDFLSASCNKDRIAKVIAEWVKEVLL